MSAGRKRGSFLLVGIDAEGEIRESTHASLDQAVAVGRACGKHDANGPAWRSWEVWGNHPETGEWSPLVCSSIAKFRVGGIVVSPSALSHLSRDDILAAIGRHQAGDWSDMEECNRQANERALVAGARLLSAYRAANGIRFWIITEANRHLTTVLLPEDD